MSTELTIFLIVYVMAIAIAIFFIQKNEKLKAIYRTAHSSMPLPAYTWAHIEAELSKEDREKIRDWTGVRK